MDTPVPGAGIHRLTDSKPIKMVYASGFFNPLEWVWDLIDAGEAIGNLEYSISAKN